MAYPYVFNLNTLTIIDPTEIFGKDANRLLEACNRAFHNWLPNGKYAFVAAMTKLESADYEAVNEDFYCGKWEDYRDKQFRIIYGIARRHGLYLEWHGTSSAACYGDQWTIYKHNKRIGRIYCF